PVTSIGTVDGSAPEVSIDASPAALTPQDRSGGPGQRGLDGQNGQFGDRGVNGQDGAPTTGWLDADCAQLGELYTGGQGQAGEAGTNGENGFAGDNGGNGGDIVLDVPPGATTGDYSLRSDGGPGGDGGNGGDGGDGGYGGDGGNS